MPLIDNVFFPSVVSLIKQAICPPLPPCKMLTSVRSVPSAQMLFLLLQVPNWHRHW